MATYNISIYNTGIDNFTSLGPMVEYGYDTFNLHYLETNAFNRTNIYTYINDKHASIMDAHVITVASDYPGEYSLISNRHDVPVICLERHSKAAMRYMLNTISKSTHLPDNYRPIKGAGPLVVSDPRNISYTPEVVGNSNKIVAKPNHGANGENVHCIDLSKHSLIAYMNNLKLGDGAMFCVEEYISNIKSEYRIIFSAGELYFFPRAHTLYKEQNIKIASAVSTYGDHGGMGLDPSDVDDLRNTIGPNAEHLMTLIDGLSIPFGSIDLFITDNNEWGIFEWCPQFGIQGIHPTLVKKIHTNALIDLLDKSGLRKKST